MLVTLIPQLTKHTVLLMPVALHLRAICQLLVITDGIANGAACYHRCLRADVSPALISGRTVFPCVSKMGFCVLWEISQRFSLAGPEIKPGGNYLLFLFIPWFSEVFLSRCETVFRDKWEISQRFSFQGFAPRVVLATLVPLLFRCGVSGRG